MSRPVKPDAAVRRNLGRRWCNMMARCYDENHPRYPQYGGAGVTVDPLWQDKETFLESAKTLPGYDQALLLFGKLHLDKDSLERDNKLYSPSACVFISPEENNKHKPNQMKEMVGTDPSGKEFEFTNQSEFAKQHDLNQGTISSCLKGKIKKHDGWSFRYKE